MINRAEIQESAREWGLRPEVVEKDYVLGWVLAGISQHPVIKNWIFKGGTCLKKCYFETYRFSEDLDFTISQDQPFDEAILIRSLREISGWVYEQCGVSIPQDRITLEKYRTPRETDSIEGRLYYSGPLAPRGNLPRIKLDLTQDEIVVAHAVSRNVAHPYSDQLPEKSAVLCYSFEELFAEKLRAFVDRLLPRDLYDIVNIYRHEILERDPQKIRTIVDKKCAFKRISFPTLPQLRSHRRYSELSSEWENMLGHQLPTLPPLASFWDTVPEILSWLSGVRKPEAKPTFPIEKDTDRKWRPSPTITRWGTAIPLEIIRFAGANHLCVEMYYRKQGHERNHYIVEPYSLRRTLAGNLILYARRTDNKGDRSFRIDWIDHVAVANQSFNPAYQIEFSGTGTISSPPVSSSRKPRLGRRRRQW